MRGWAAIPCFEGWRRTGYAGEEGRLQARVDVHGTGAANVDTGIPVLDHLLALLAEHASFDLALEVAPEEPDAEVAAAGRALGEALADALHAESARGHGSAVVPADEALAHVALEVSDRPLLVSNVDLSDMGVGGSRPTSSRAFCTELAEGAGLTLHVRLIEGRDPQHVLEAIFKALGVALAQSCRPREERRRWRRASRSSGPSSAPAPFQGAPYSQAIRAGDFVFVSGQLGLRPGHGGARRLDRGADRAGLRQPRRDPRGGGHGLDRLVKTTVFLADLGDFAAMNEVYARHVGDSPPARSTVEVSALPSGAKVEIEAIAAL